ncbi:MAG: hypothetical protein KIH69_005070 [Anaerolineae bacterium]|nr:hypothetical protein [Anaerolineae bacterium]
MVAPRYRPSLVFSLALSLTMLISHVPTQPLQATPSATPILNNQIVIYADQNLGTFSTNLLGSNLPAWVGSEKTDRLGNATFRQQIKAAGIPLFRAPGSSWGNQYGWLSCEMGVNQAKAQPCGDNWFWAARPSDYIGFANATNANLLWTVNPNGTAKEAAAAVAFFNGAISDTKIIGIDQHGFDWKTVGHWATLRAQRGYPQPLNIAWWQVGNELYGNKACFATGWENYWTCDASDYVNGKGTGAGRQDGFLDFQAAMKQVDARINVGAVGWVNQNEYNNWGNKVIAGTKNALGFYAVHHFPFNEPPPVVSSGAAIITQAYGTLKTIKADIASAMQRHAGGNVQIAITQYGLATRAILTPTNQLIPTTAYALFVADSIGQMAEHGYSLANHWSIASGEDVTGIDFGAIRVEQQFKRTPAYFVWPMWAKFGNTRLALANALSPETQLAAYAGRNENGQLTLLAINKTGNEVKTNIVIHTENGPAYISNGDVYSLRSNGLDDTMPIFNGMSTPSDDLANAPPQPLSDQNASGPSLIRSYTFAPYSVTLLRVNTHQAANKAYLPLGLR